MTNKLRQIDKSWIGVDLDRTLAYYDGWKLDPETGLGRIGAPIEPMRYRVRKWLEAGETVKIFTARVSSDRAPEERARMVAAIERWCQTYLGAILEVTAEKNFHMKALYDDLAWHVTPNQGYVSQEELT